MPAELVTDVAVGTSPCHVSHNSDFTLNAHLRKSVICAIGPESGIRLYVKPTPARTVVAGSNIINAAIRRQSSAVRTMKRPRRAPWPVVELGMETAGARIA
jgi:hypothetical protein